MFLYQFWESGWCFELEIFEILLITNCRNFLNWKIANIKIYKDEVFDNFIFELFFHFLEIIRTPKIFNNFRYCKIFLFQISKFVKCQLSKLLNFENSWIFKIQQLYQFWKSGWFFKLEIFRILLIRNRRNFLNWEIANIKIDKDELFDNFIFELFFHFLEIIRTPKIFNNFWYCKIFLFQISKFVKCQLSKLLNFQNSWIFKIQQLYQFWESADFSN